MGGYNPLENLAPDTVALPLKGKPKDENIYENKEGWTSFLRNI